MLTLVSDSSLHSPVQLGSLVVVSGPSGSGKTTLCRRSTEAGLTQYSISCTTRTPRPGEQDGIDYHFLSLPEFRVKVADGEFLEYAEVHGNFYGTLKADILELLHQGKTLVLDIDVQGAAQVRACTDEKIQSCYVDLFIRVPLDELEKRLRGRQSDSEEAIQLRLKNAAEEEIHSPLYQYCLISADRESDYTRFLDILKGLKKK